MLVVKKKFKISPPHATNSVMYFYLIKAHSQDAMWVSTFYNPFFFTFVPDELL